MRGNHRLNPCLVVVKQNDVSRGQSNNRVIQFLSFPGSGK